jgi:hypothetical protein
MEVGGGWLTLRFFFCGEGTRPRAEATAAWWQCNLYASFLKKEKIYTRAVPVRCSHHPCPSLIQVFSIFGSAPCSTAADRERSIITPEPRGRESSPTRTRNHKRDHHQASSRHPFSSGMHEHDADGDLPPESMLRRRSLNSSSSGDRRAEQRSMQAPVLFDSAPAASAAAAHLIAAGHGRPPITHSLGHLLMNPDYLAAARTWSVPVHSQYYHHPIPIMSSSSSIIVRACQVLTPAACQRFLCAAGVCVRALDFSQNRKGGAGAARIATRQLTRWGPCAPAHPPHRQVRRSLCPAPFFLLLPLSGAVRSFGRLGCERQAEAASSRPAIATGVDPPPPGRCRYPPEPRAPPPLDSACCCSAPRLVSSVGG